MKGTHPIAWGCSPPVTWNGVWNPDILKQSFFNLNGQHSNCFITDKCNYVENM